MPTAGNQFITTLKTAHIKWGEHRYTNSRGIVYGEGYLMIPASRAYLFEITNHHSTARPAEYDFSTSDGFITNGRLLASGNQYRPEFAKQFHGLGNLQLLGDWYAHLGVSEGDQIKIEFLNPTSIMLTKV